MLYCIFINDIQMSPKHQNIITNIILMQMNIKQMNVTILGCGSSVGVPVIGCNCDICSLTEPKNKRSRSSILIETPLGEKILVDFGADMREQFLHHKISKISAAILTHDHADHVNGIDDLKIFSFINKTPIVIYSDKIALNSIALRFPYMFESQDAEDHWGRRRVEGIEVQYDSTTTICNTKIAFFRQHHGFIDSLGIRIGNFAYSNDVVEFPKESEKYLENLDIWVIDCLHYTRTKAHFGLEDVLKCNEKFKPKKIYLTNMSHSIDYNKIKTEIPENIEPAYDGLSFLI
jgi:phosphoribosyl 1,2-cyclic phosphate phosphodiesterase